MIIQLLSPALVVYSDAWQRIKNDLNQSLTVNATMSPARALTVILIMVSPAHEYGHGISNRLTGGPGTVSCLNNGEQMGEGWVDGFALMMTTDWNTATLADSALHQDLSATMHLVLPKLWWYKGTSLFKLFLNRTHGLDVLKQILYTWIQCQFQNPGAV